MMRATSIRQILGKVDEELLLEPFGVAVQVSHGRSKVHMPHLLLDCQDASSAVHEIGGEAVTDQVRVDTLADASTLNTGTATTYIVVTLQNSVSADSCYVSSGSVAVAEGVVTPHTRRYLSRTGIYDRGIGQRRA